MWQSIKNQYHLLVSMVAAGYYGFPARKIKVVGITGTDGKTTTTHLIHHLLSTSGKKASMVSSVYAEIAGTTYDTGFHVTTPDSFVLQKFLRHAVDGGDEFMVLEVTSHGLDQNRVVGIDFEVGVLTNVTHEHLDYHHTYEMYLRTKEKLLQRARTAIVNRDDESYRYWDKNEYKRRMITYGLSKDADVHPQTFPFISPLPGEYNRYNCLAAIATCRLLGVSDYEVRRGLKSFKGIKGRFERISNSFGLEIIIDFAHTPNAIDSVLSAVKKDAKVKLIHVFGSAAKRDYLKRPIMGSKSAAIADVIILTEEDYRDEDINAIIDQIAQGAIKAGAIELSPREFEKAYKLKKPVLFRVPDRQDAVNLAIAKLAKKGDTIILTGKAHEKSLARGSVEHPWSEHEAVEIALKKRHAK